MGGYEAAKDRVNQLFGGSTSGNVKLKPVLVYHSENPRTLKNIAMGYFPIVWESNPKDSVTQAIFQDWFFHHFIPEIEKYCLEQNILFNILLLLDNAQATLIHGRLSSQCESSASDIKYCVAHPTYGPGSYTAETFKVYYICQTFHQAVKATDE